MRHVRAARRIVREKTEILNSRGEHIATIGLNDSFGLWQIVIVRNKEVEFFCLTKEMAIAAWDEEFDPETGFPQREPLGDGSDINES
jgi:hypothetical protein